jgi:pimeloyl-ACP methyl ester carboxylesterase
MRPNKAVELGGDITEHQVLSNGTKLNVLELAPENRDKASIVMLHGLRDSAHSLLPVALHLAQDFHVLLPELRGHGNSDASDAYGVFDFVQDLHEVIDGLAAQNVGLFGHSLGGHIVSKYAAIFPQRIAAIAIVEGLGPPHRAQEDNEAAEMQALGFMILNRLRRQPGKSRPIQDPEDAANRLVRNNPRLNPATAAELAPHLLKATDTGYAWAFDSRASSVFVGASRANDAIFWRNIKAPTCVISGSLSYEYWEREMGDEAYDGRFAPGEMEQRIDEFQDCVHHWFEGSGHMVHYDEPQRLAQQCYDFFTNKIAH